ncbi:MAG: hypothetical protein LBK95_05560 [Bifidobacteriaceae bacterium]|jgi:predicted transcriptional regulator|nr:hypothetical protein [Bifidobacteriaceae bacterium]
MISQDLLSALDELSAREKHDVMVYLQTGSVEWAEKLNFAELADLIERIEAVFAEPSTARSLDQEFDRTPVGAEWKASAEAGRQATTDHITMHELRRLIHQH